MADNSPQVLQAKAWQEMADNRLQALQTKARQQGKPLDPPDGLSDAAALRFDLSELEKLLASERILEGWSERLTFTPQAGSTIWYARQENSGRTATLERLETALTAAAGWAEKPSEQD